jgi:gliding motility-associated-like protein
MRTLVSALVYNIGTINPNDSAIISYAYYFNNLTGVDSAFPDPKLVVNGVGMPVIPPPTPNNDTIDICGLGLTTIPANILNATDKCWSWSSWTWSPALGLATTTGVNNTINVSILPATFTYTITGTDSAFGMSSCNHKVFYLTIKSCNNITINTPCVGDTLKFNAPGDSTGATYQWYGPAPSTAVFATTQSTFKFPSTWADTGTYHVIKTVAGIPDTGFTVAFLNPLPTISGSTSICLGTTSTLTSNIVGSTWTSLNTSVATVNPATGVVSGVGVGTATIVNTSPAGCKSSVIVNVFVLPPILGPTTLCMGASVTLTDSVAGGTWLSDNFAVATVGLSTGVVTGIGGGTAKITYSAGGCIAITTVSVSPTSPISGTAEMCQYFTTTLGNAYTGGTWSTGASAIATVNPASGVVYGVSGGTATIFYTLSSGCQVSKVVTVHPKPAPPTALPNEVCQFSVPYPVSVEAGGYLPGATLTWYGPGLTPGSTVPPMVPTDSPGTVHVYVTQTSTFGCTSDSTHTWRVVKPLPPAPGTEDVKYCQQFNAEVLTATGVPGGTLNWYTTASGGVKLPGAPDPATDYVGNTTYYVSQTLNGCEGPRSPLKVEVMYLPNFTITASNGKVCQHDSLTFMYNGPALVNPSFAWELPIGASFVNGSSAYDAAVTVRFDTTWGKHILKLTAWNLKDQCSTTVPIEVNVIPQPAAYAFTKLDVCIHDTVSLALQGRTTNAEEFLWWIDGNVMKTAPELNIVTSNVKSGGPYLISWNKPGRHVVQVKAMADNECPAKTTSDTINVHALPDATFKFDTLIKGRLCLEDSIIFAANYVDYNCSYEWTPAHFFDNLNKPTAWGRIGQNNSVIMLKVTDPFGCVGAEKKEFKAESCCKVTFPTAFTPNNDGHNDRFRPIFAGYHRFHTFKVTNRWGQLLFESSTNEPAWDGSFNGVPQDMGVYFYYIKYDCGGKTLEEKGEITLVR